MVDITCSIVYVSRHSGTYDYRVWKTGLPVLELHNRTAKIESDPHRTRSGEGSVPSLGNRTGFGFHRVKPIRVRLKPLVTVFAVLSD
jgi:hypothetical protein